MLSNSLLYVFYIFYFACIALFSLNLDNYKVK
nr:MAG TPA: hypothetical protein [Caudoviricetes sp.]